MNEIKFAIKSLERMSLDTHIESEDKPMLKATILFFLADRGIIEYTPSIEENQLIEQFMGKYTDIYNNMRTVISNSYSQDLWTETLQEIYKELKNEY